MNTNLLNIIGLFFDILGAWFVAIEVVKQYKGQKHKGGLLHMGQSIEPVPTKKFVAWEKSKYLFMWVGLFFLTIGFLLQITANIIGYNRETQQTFYPSNNLQHTIVSPTPSTIENAVKPHQIKKSENNIAPQIKTETETKKEENNIK